jgi:hypothetical protein
MTYDLLTIKLQKSRIEIKIEIAAVDLIKKDFHRDNRR